MMNRRNLALVLSILVCTACFAAGTTAEARVQDRIARRIEAASTVLLRGNVHPMAISQNERGKVSGSLRVERVTIVFKPTDAQQAELNALIAQQQDPASPNYRRWLSPEEFAGRF